MQDNADAEMKKIVLQTKGYDTWKGIFMRLFFILFYF